MVVKSILDTDLYKFTTSYAYMKLFPNAEGTFSFIDRDNTEYDEEFILMLNMELLNLYSLSLSIEEKDYMIANCRFIPAVYWEWLSSFKFDPSRVVISLDENKHLNIDVTDSLYKVTLYEVPILAIVSEVRNAWLSNTPDSDWKQRLYDKVQMSNQHALPFSEFGTRRRFSYEVQESDFVIFVLEDFKWSQPLNTMSKGILSEFVWCLNHRKPYYICYRSAAGLGIYGAQIDETAVFRGGESILLSGVASTKDSLPLVAQTCSNIYYMGGNLYIKSGEDKSSIETESNFY